MSIEPAAPKESPRDPFPTEFEVQKQAWRDGCSCLWMNDVRIRHTDGCPLHASEA